MKNPIQTINVDVHSNGAVWVSFGRKNPRAIAPGKHFRSYWICSTDDAERRYSHLRRGYQAQAALLERGEQ